MFAEALGSSEVSVRPKVDLERFGMVWWPENSVSCMLGSFSIGVERCLEIPANSFHGNFVTAPWIV